MMDRTARESDWSRISDPRLKEVMGRVDRRFFVPDELADERRSVALADGQSVSRPLIVAIMVEALLPGPGDRVLEVGTGSGYQTAILAEMAGQVFSVEIDQRLSQKAESRLRELGCRNVELRVGDGYDGWIEQAPFDRILVAAAVEEVPPTLMDQLKDGGCMVIPLGTPFGPQELTVVEKQGREVITRTLFPIRFVSFRRKLG